MALNGLDGFLVYVQVDVSNGLPFWEIVGLPDTSVRESKERVRVAIKNSGYEFLSKRVVVNLAPANTKKGGSIFDLPIAIGILCALGMANMECLEDYLFVGELSLDGKVRKTNGILPICIEAKRLGIKNIIISEECAKEASLVNGINIFPVVSLSEVINHLNGITTITKMTRVSRNVTVGKPEEILDFSDVKGQEPVKRVLEISAAGGHNCLMNGNPGCGKTMLAKRIPSILPDLTFEETLEISKIHSVAGSLKEDNLITKRPFRSPHYTISANALVGGGANPKPGEISLAHYGVLFLDELPEYKNSILELLRTPLEDGEITISRTNFKHTYPCKFMLIAAMNPCPCGNYGLKNRECTCTNEMIKRYSSRISGPLLDRFDISIHVSSIKYDEINESVKIESSEKIKRRVDIARKIQQERYKEYGIFSNSELTQNLIEKFCKIDKVTTLILKNAFEKMHLTARGYSKILKVSRTIADLEGKENIQKNHVAEAIQYRLI